MVSTGRTPGLPVPVDPRRYDSLVGWDTTECGDAKCGQILRVDPGTPAPRAVRSSLSLYVPGAFPHTGMD